MKKFLLFTLLFLIAIFATLPYLLSSRFGKPFLIRYLEKRYSGNIAIEEVHLTWLGPQVFKNGSFANPEIIATARLIESPVPLWDLKTAKQNFQLQDATFKFLNYNAQIIDTQVTVQKNAIKVTAVTPEGGSINIQGAFLSKDNFNGTISLHEIPTIAASILLKMDFLPIFLGPTFNLKGDISHTTITANLSSNQVTASTQAKIVDQTLFFEGLDISLIVSNALYNEITKHISPNILTAFTLKNPITLHIPSGSFQLPLSQLQLSQATIDLGKARIVSGETLRSILSIFKETSNTFDIWFSPITLNLQNDQIQLDRFDALIDQIIHLCSWGDIRNQKLYMTLGVPSDTLQSAFGIQTLSPNYVLTIPIRGTLQNPKFDAGKAIAKIAAIGASKQIPTKAGKIFGEAVNIFTQAQDEENIPPPKRPFPWE